MLNERLTQLRKRSGLTQADIAKHLKITRQAYSSYESNHRQMDFASLCLIADFYNVTADYLLGRGEICNPTFTNGEIEVIEKYRALDSRGKDAVTALLDFEYLNITKDGNEKKPAM